MKVRGFIFFNHGALVELRPVLFNNIMENKSINIVIQEELSKHLKKLYGLTTEDIEKQPQPQQRKQNQQGYWKITRLGKTLGWFLAWIENGRLETEFRI